MIKGNNLFLKIMVGALMCLVLAPANALGYVVYNGSGTGYCDPISDPGCDNNVNSSNSLSGPASASMIESFIEEGGGYFLNAFSNILTLSNRVEMSNLNAVDYKELQKIAETGLANLQNAKSTYHLLILTAHSTPYNPAVISKLKAFDYNGFMRKNSLNGVILKELEDYLGMGDITGIYKRFYSKLIFMEGLLLSIKHRVDLNQLPGISEIWQLNETASNNLQFGQYAARVFAELAK